VVFEPQGLRFLRRCGWGFHSSGI